MCHLISAINIRLRSARTHGLDRVKSYIAYVYQHIYNNNNVIEYYVCILCYIDCYDQTSLPVS